MATNALKTIIITGCNRGLGEAIVENLCQKNYKIIMACRNIKAAEEAKKRLIQTHGKAIDKLFTMQLDLAQKDSIDKFVIDFKQQFGEADILVNNAAVLLGGNDYESALKTLATNFYGTIDFTQKMVQNVKNKGKIITFSSSDGMYNCIRDQKIKKEFDDPNLSMEGLYKLSQRYLDDRKSGHSDGWPSDSYSFSKLLISVWVRIFAKNKEIQNRQLQVYALCPGWVRTEMGGSSAPLSIQEGIDTPIWLIEQPFELNPNLQGQFIRQRKPHSLWDSLSYFY